jgi:hypothetical protein
MPVILSDSNIRWSEQDDKSNYDYKDVFPEKIKSENGSPTLQFPFTREMSSHPYTGIV